jgi:hypothetical protein
MSESVALSLFDSLSQVPDPRLDRTKLHQLADILVIAVCATICAAETGKRSPSSGRPKRVGSGSSRRCPTVSRRTTPSAVSSCA